MDRLQRAGLDPRRILAVPFADKGRGWDGWDCWGCVRTLAPLVYGIQVPSFFDDYTSADFESRAALDALIGRQMAAFEEGPPGEAFPLLTFVRFGARSHTGLAISNAEMIHADGDTKGGTYRVRFDAGDWARPKRACRAFRPRGWVLT